MTRRVLTLIVIGLAIILMMPQTIPAVRFLAFGIVEGDWLNDWGLIDHGWLAGSLGFASDVLSGRVTVDYPWEDTLPGPVASLMYTGGSNGLQ